MPIPEGLKHLVVLMQENRSFDHVLGSLSKEGRTDVDGIGDSVTYRDGSGNPVAPRIITNNRAYEFYPDPPHHYRACEKHLRGDFVKAFLDAHPGAKDDHPEDVLGYLTREHLPVTYFLADCYTICDRWFASVPASTMPNRMFAWAGHCENHRDTFQAFDITLTTIWELLEERHIDWRVYYSVLPCTGLLYNPRTRAFLDRVSPIQRFFDDAKRPNGLPRVTWIEPRYSWSRLWRKNHVTNDDHPPSDIRRGQKLISDIYRGLLAGPLWDHAALVIVYDEHGGFADHVEPPALPEAFRTEHFSTYGFRVPAIVVSPFVEAGRVFKERMDHCSILKLICEWTSIDPSRLSPRVASNDICSLSRVLTDDPGRPRGT